MIYVLENPMPREGKMKYVHKDVGLHLGYTRTYCWHLGVAKKWKTRRGVERWLDVNPGFRRDFFIRELDD